MINLTWALEVVSQSMAELCLASFTSALCLNAFSHFSGLRVLAPSLRLPQLLLGALSGLGQLFFIGFYTDYLLPDGNLSFLQHLFFLGPCQDGNMGFWLPPSLWRLRVKSSCLQNVGELVDIFPDPVLGPSSGDAWPPGMLELSFNCWLNMASPGALQGLKLGTLCLDHMKVKVAAGEDWGCRTWTCCL